MVIFLCFCLFLRCWSNPGLKIVLGYFSLVANLVVLLLPGPLLVSVLSRVVENTEHTCIN